MGSREKHSVLIVDNTKEDIALLKSSLGESYTVKAATSGRSALKAAFSSKPPHIILLNVVLPDTDGYEICKILKADTRTQQVPIILVTATENEDEAQGLSLGAADFLTKPIRPAILHARIKTHLELSDRSRQLAALVNEQTQHLHDYARQLLATQQQIIRCLGLTGEYRDNESGLHVIRLSHYARLLSLKIGLAANEAEQIMHASLMHDIGKITIPDSILLKSGELTDEEIAIVRTHPTVGAKIIGEHPSGLLNLARNIALTHHEKWNGEGYPSGLAGQSIPLAGRIVAIADTFDALTSKRPHKKAWAIDDALEYIEKEAGASFDPILAPLFVSLRPELGQFKILMDESPTKQ